MIFRVEQRRKRNKIEVAVRTHDQPVNAQRQPRQHGPAQRLVESPEHLRQRGFAHPFAHILLIRPHPRVDLRRGAERDPPARSIAGQNDGAISRLRSEAPRVPVISHIFHQRRIARQRLPNLGNVSGQGAADFAAADALLREIRLEFLLLFFQGLALGQRRRRISGPGGVLLLAGQPRREQPPLFHQFPHAGIAFRPRHGLVLQQRIEHDALRPQNHLREQIGIGQGGGKIARLQGPLEVHPLPFRGEGKDPVERVLLRFGHVAGQPGRLVRHPQFHLQVSQVGGDGHGIGMIFAEGFPVNLQRLFIEGERLRQTALRVVVPRERRQAGRDLGMLRAQRLAANLQRLREQRLRLVVKLSAVIRQRELDLASCLVEIVGLKRLLPQLHRAQQERLGPGIVPLSHVEQPKLTQGRDGQGMVRREPGCPDAQRPLKVALGFVVIAQTAVELREVVQGRGHRQAVRTKRLFPHRQRLREKFLRGRVIARDPVKRGQVVPRRRGVGILRPEHLFPDRDGLLVKRLGQRQVAPVFLERAQRVQHFRYRGRFQAQPPLTNFQATVQRLLRLFVAGHIVVKPAQVQQRIRHRQRVPAGTLLLRLKRAEE